MSILVPAEDYRLARDSSCLVVTRLRYFTLMADKNPRLFRISAVVPLEDARSVYMSRWTRSSYKIADFESSFRPVTIAASPYLLGSELLASANASPGLKLRQVLGVLPSA